jgi:L-ascorbate metabolism protein UlaG (beta-lactamase superfamily)
VWEHFTLPAALRLALNADQVRFTYVGHSTFLIESPQLVRIATDYNDYVRSPVLPDIITMNHVHTSHFTDRPDPAIQYVLRGWGPTPDQPARHDITLKDVRVRNVPTNIRDCAAAPSGMAIRSSSMRWRTCASPISGICITRSTSSNWTRLVGSTLCSSRSTAI